MGAETKTTLTNILKEHYPPGGIVNAVNVDTFILDKLERAKKFTMIGGRYFDKPVRLALTGGAGPRGELSPLPTPANFQYQSVQIPVRYHYGVIQLTGPAIYLSKGDKNAFAEALAITMDGMLEEFRLVAAQLAYGWGTGIIGQVLSVSGNVLSLADDIHPATFFYEGQVIDSYQADEATLRVSGMIVTAVDPIARTVTVNAAGATAATDRLVFTSALNLAPMGLLGSVDDSTYIPNYFNINRTVTPRWKSYIDAQGGTGPVGGTPTKYGAAAALRRAITGDLIQRTLDQQRIKAGAARPVDQMISNLFVRRMFWNSLSPDRRFESTMYDGGWEELKFSNGDKTIPWFADELCYRQMLFLLHFGAISARVEGRGNVPTLPASHKVDKVQDEEVLAIYESPFGAAEWDEATGAQLKQLYSGANFLDAVGAFLKWYYNIATCRPNIHARIDDLLEG